MAVNWEIRHEGDEPPEYLPTAELFTIQLHYLVDEVEPKSWFIDYCCADQISKIEIISMARELGVDLERHRLLWLDKKSPSKELREIRTDIDALAMANSVDETREIDVFLEKVVSDGEKQHVVDEKDLSDGEHLDEVDTNVVSEHEKEQDGVRGENMNVAGVIERVDGEDGVDEEDELHGVAGNSDDDDDVSFHYSDYSFHGETDDEDLEGTPGNRTRAEVEVEGDFGSDEETDYGRSEELQSCSSTDEDSIGHVKPKFAEFNEELDMENPQFKIGMKFASFTQFKEAVKNYGIKNRYCLKFKPNNKKKCKAFCQKACPFYLWASPMVTDRNTVQIKTGCLQHECTRDHVNKHVNAAWIARKYLEQFRADPTWKISGVIQAVKTNQEVDISRLQAYRARCIAMNEVIRTKLMKRIQQRRDAMVRVTSTFCPKIMKKLEKFKQLSFFCNTTWSGGDKYQVQGSDGQYVVDKKKHTCSCRRWQLSGIPCAHAISVLFYNKEKPENYIHSYYRVSTFMDTYRHILNPTHDKDSWPRSEQGPVIPPEPVNKRRGRKTVLRRREEGETLGINKGRVTKIGVKMTCKICGATGHNRRFHGNQGNKGGTVAEGQQDQNAMAPHTETEFPAPEPNEDQATGTGHVPGSQDCQPGERSRHFPVQNNQPQCSNESQVVQVPVQMLQVSMLPTIVQVRRPKLMTRGSIKARTTEATTAEAKRAEAGTAEARTAEARSDQALAAGKGKAEDKGKAMAAGKRRKIWVPPGIGSAAASTDQQKKPS